MPELKFQTSYSRGSNVCRRRSLTRDWQFRAWQFRACHSVCSNSSSSGDS